MKQKSILVGKEGKASLIGVFAQMSTSQNNLFVNSVNKKKEPYFRVYTEQDVEKFDRVNQVQLNDSIIIRWGTRVVIPENGCVIYNTTKAIANSSHKFNTRKILQAAGVAIPEIVTPANFNLENLPIVARPFQHKQGKDFVVIEDYGSFEQFYNKNKNEWYFSTYIDKDAEYRVHCAHGRILSIMKKPRPEDPSVKAWNHAQVDEAFDAVPWSEWDLELGKTALRACKALELDFCGLDVIVKDGRSYVLEANTSPSLATSPYNTEKYAKYFDWLMKSEEKRPHWEFEDKQKATSLAWKEWMFEDRAPNPIVKKKKSI